MDVSNSNVNKNQTGFHSWQWIRVQSGTYKGDIGQVDFVDMAKNEVRLKLLPRIDYTRLKTTQSNMNGEEHEIEERPAAKPFDPESIRLVNCVMAIYIYCFSSVCIL